MCDPHDSPVPFLKMGTTNRSATPQVLFQTSNDTNVVALYVSGSVKEEIENALGKILANSDAFRHFSVSLNFTQLIESPTHPNLNFPDKSSLIDLFLTNVPHKYSMAGTFANDISDHCVIAAVRNAKVLKTKPHFVIKCNMKAFVEQGFHHDLYDFDWERIELCNDVQTA